MNDASRAASHRSDTRGTRGGFALASLPSSIRDAVRELDKDGSGYVEEAEFVAAVEAMVQQRRDSRLLKHILAAAVVLNLLLSAAVVGCVVALKDTASSGGALVDKASGVPLATGAALGRQDLSALWRGADDASMAGLSVIYATGADGVRRMWRVAGVEVAAGEWARVNT
jgi:hypothetical protein